MDKHKYIFCVLTSFLAFVGCNDDSSGSIIVDGTVGCTAGGDCRVNDQCIDENCIEREDDPVLKLECDEDNPCEGSKECVDGRCKVIKSKCSEDSECSENEVCVDGKCASVKYLNEGDTCNPVSKQEVCGADLECKDETCQKVVIEDPQKEKCENDEDCADAGEGLICLSNGRCGKIGELGEACGEDVECPDDMTCQVACVYLKHENEACDEDNWLICDESEGLVCIDGGCHIPKQALEKGEACNESYLKCKEGLSCENSVCSSVVVEGNACDLENNLICGDGQECILGICKSVMGECKENKDCKTKDSYCCLDESCGLVNHCLPNEDGAYDEGCYFKTKPGIFEAQIQCRWQPPQDDEYAASTKVEMPPIVGKFGNYKTKKGKDIDQVIAVWSFNKRYTKVADINASDHLSAIRFINPENCETLETIPLEMGCSWHNYPSAADLDGKDGRMELIVIGVDGYPVAYRWDENKQKHVQYWKGSVVSGDMPVIFDINNDKVPEVILGDAVINGQTGKTIVKGSVNASTGETVDFSYRTLAVGYLDNKDDGLATMVIKNKVNKWNKKDKKWNVIATLPANRVHLAYADFGTAGTAPEKFNFAKLDQNPEIVSVGSGKLSVFALVDKGDGSGTFNVQEVMAVDLTPPIDSTSEKPVGGPITIGDFDSDGLPEIGIASSGFFGVYDPRCKKYKEGECADKNVLWERWSQDASSGETGSTLFDFDGDGQAEAVYADECFTRIYDGKTGKVLFSAKRSSSTSIEAPSVVDADGDGSAEILMGSDNNNSCYDDTKTKVSYSSKTSNCVDPIHEGIPCMDDEDCPLSKNCNKALGLCLCSSDDDCNTQKDPNDSNKILQQYVCAEPIHPMVGMMTNPNAGASRTMVKDIGTRPDKYDKSYKVCRATRKTKEIGNADLMIFKDRLDRWVSSRKLWNQHVYNIININDDGGLPDYTTWSKNWKKLSTTKKIDNSETAAPEYNNYRLNEQGAFGAGKAPDITGRFIPGSICGTVSGDDGDDAKYMISGKLCNRGTKPVSQNLPATFFYYDESKPNHRGDVICTSYTQTVVGIGECSAVGCEITKDQLDSLAGKTVLMVANLDEKGLASTIECNTDNNTDTVTVDGCEDKIEIN